MTLSRTKTIFLDKLRDRNITVKIIPGNHDCPLKNTNEHNSLKLLLSEYDNIEVFENPTTLTYDDISIDMIPWINQENYDSTLHYIQESTSDYLYGHLELQGYELYAGRKAEHGMSDEIFSKYKEVWSGHFHHKSQNKNIKYLGAPMQFTFADAECDRGFHMFDTETKDLTFIKNPHTLYEKVYYDDSNDENCKLYKSSDCSEYANKFIKLFVLKKENPSLFETYLDKFYTQDVINLIIHEDYSEFHESNVDIEVQSQSTQELITAYLDKLETDMNKDLLSNMMNSIYMEALYEE